MSRFVGPDSAVTLHMPYTAAVLRLWVQKYGAATMNVTARNQYRAERVLRRVRRACTDWTPPTGRRDDPLLATGFPHQQQAVHTFEALPHVTGWLVADDVGVGKTWQALVWAHRVVQAKRVLVVTKNIAKDQWVDAITHWIGATERVVGVDGAKPAQHTAITDKTARWCVAHWESLPLHEAAYRKQRYDAIILDEVQMICNRNTRRALVAHALRAPHRMALSAHPYTNDVGELYSVLRFLYPAAYASYWRFFHLHVEATPKQFGGFDITGVRRPKLLQWELAPFQVRRTRAQVSTSLPQLTRTARTVHLPPAMQREYRELQTQLFAELEDMDRNMIKLPIINDFVRLTRVRQYLVDPGLLNARAKSLKYPVVAELLLDIDKPTVVFSEFAQALQRLGTYLSTKHRLKVAHIHGGMSRDKLRAAKQAFIGGKVQALLVVGKSGDTALNLGKYGYCIHLDLPWNPRGLEQREGRVDRPEEHTGKRVHTTAYYITVANTYEDRLLRKLENRHAQFSRVFNPLDLKELFR